MAKIRIKNVSVEFRVSRGARSALRGLTRYTGGQLDIQSGRVRALDGISLSVDKGERVGLIGHNGAGKSTLLRTIAGIYAPREGRVQVKGNVSALFQASPGIEPDDNGYQNILNCGLFLGMSRKEIAAKAQDIASFTELGEYLDLPVRIYSAGMMMRLSFAIATAIDPQILLVDEALGAGDARFALKAQQRVFQLADRSSILIMASHSPGLLSSICSRGVYMEQGRIIADGPIREVIDVYHRTVAENAAKGDDESQLKVLQLAQESVARGDDVPVFLEEQSLWVAIRVDPGDPNKLQRLCRLLGDQGKPVPRELEIETLEAVLKASPDDRRSIERLAQLRNDSASELMGANA